MKAHPGLLAGVLPLDPAGRGPGPWAASAQLADGCLWAEVGSVDYRAGFVQLLMKDTRAGVQKAFTLHRGEVIGVGRFTVRIAPRNGGGAGFDVDVNWTP